MHAIFCYLLICFAICAPALLHAQQASFSPDEAGFQQKVAPFLQTHCVRCHGPEDQQGELRVDQDLSTDFTKPQSLSEWNEVVNVLNSHEMPPEDEPQPSSNDVALVVDWITEQAKLAEAHRRSSNIVLRRLNRNEYQNVIRDLAGIRYETKHFPQDPPAGGFDNNGTALNLSPMQLELYYDAASQVLDKAIVHGEQPKSIKWRIEPESGNSDSNRVSFLDQRPIVNGGNNEVKDNCVVLHHESWDKKVNTRDFKLNDAGEYIIRIRGGGRIPTRDQVVESADRFLRERRDKEISEHPERAKYIEGDYTRTLEHFKTDRMYDYGPPRIKVIRDLAGQPEVIAEFDIDADIKSMKEYEVRTKFSTDKAGITIEYAYDIPKELENFWFQTGDQFARPEAWIDWIELEGPVFETWLPASHQKVLLDQEQHKLDDVKHAERVIRSFMQYAYRRNVTNDEVNAKMELFNAAAQNATLFEEAIKLPLSSILISPEFLYITETTPVGQPLNDFELASRLSFFLWSSMPDKELLSLAFQHKLHEPATLIAQVNRMLKDERSEAFVKNFAGQWLNLRDVGANPPAMDLYRHYDRHLELSIVAESEAFFREVLHNDLSVLNFIDSDFVTINERLARFYGVENVRGDHFRKVNLPSDNPRGGILTQASILTVTSNGTRTSPVKRGTWVLKNVLGIDPGLPVANAGEIAPKVPGIDKATVRQRLEIHRELPQCARCHNKIDPLGFALENFDASGAYRKQEGFGYQGRVNEDDPAIDAASKLPDGTSIDGIEGLKAALMAKEELFLNCLANKLYTYALGRELTLADQDTLRASVSRMKQSDRSLRTLIHSIVTSQLFLQR